MRIGIALDERTALTAGSDADRAGLAAALLPDVAGGSAPLAAAVASRTRDIRLAVPVRIGEENPVTLAEEIAVLDQLSGGRVIAVVDTGDLDDDSAREDLSLLRACWSGRPVAHRGPRWSVPSGRTLRPAPERIAVTPFPAQLELPVWLTGAAASRLGARFGIPAFLDEPPAAPAAGPLAAPAVTGITGDLDEDRARVARWEESGATPLFLRLPGDGSVSIERHVARFLVPEATMPAFPRIIAESPWPAPYPHSEEDHR